MKGRLAFAIMVPAGQLCMMSLKVAMAVEVKSIGPLLPSHFRMSNSHTRSGNCGSFLDFQMAFASFSSAAPLMMPPWLAI